MIMRPDPRELTQGTIFTCAISENYRDCDAFGLIITARCDVSNGKAPIFSYIPVVSYLDWVQKDGAEIVASRISANCSGELRKIVKGAGLSETIMETISHISVQEFLDKDLSKDGKGRSKRFHENMKKKETADTHLSSPTPQSSRSIILENSGVYHGLVKELTGNGVADYHYLDQIEFGKKPSGYVALLREIRFMPARVAARIIEGLDSENYAALESGGNGGMNFRSQDDYAMPIGLLQSPFIEFLMQRLTNLFSRIGVTDLDSRRIESLKQVFTEVGDDMK